MISLKSDIDAMILAKHTTKLNSGMHPSSAAAECQRSLWLDFRNVSEEKITAKRQKNFESGHIYEARIISLIKSLPNWQIKDEQKEIKFGITRGNIDGVVIHSAIEYLLEIKSMAEKYFNQLIKKGVKEFSVKHYAQIQIYMKKLGLKKCIYFAVNRNNDEFYEEIIDFDDQIASMYLFRIDEISRKKNIPEMISQNPTYFVCKMCDHYKFCHDNAQAIPTCRSCINFVVKDNIGQCEFHKKPIPIEFQHKKQTGIECNGFEIHPDLRKNLTEFDKIEEEVKQLFGNSAKRII